MTFTIRPELERELQERVKAGPYRSVDELVNAALEQFIAPDFAPGELARLVAVGKQQLADGQLVAADEVVRQVRSWGWSRRPGE